MAQKIKKNKQKKQLLWYPLDNAAKIYPPTVSKDRAHVFAVSAILNEEVDAYLLQDAVTKILNKFPTFRTKLMRGKFWYYLEQNELPVKVFKEEPYYLKHIDYKKNNGYLFEVLYIGNKITVKFFHALTDGTGGLNFFKALLVEYFAETGETVDLEDLIKPLDAPSSLFETEDSFLTYHNNSTSKSEKIPRPFHIDATPFSYDGCGLITAKVDLDGVKQLAKKYDCTVTVYLASLYMKCVFDAYLKVRPSRNKLITVLIPCNLRKKYGGETQRNFTMFARFSHDYADGELSMEELTKLCATQMKEDLDLNKLDKIIDDNVSTEKNFFIKLAPLFLKNAIMKAVYARVGEVLQTVNLSNLGLVKLPHCISDHVKDVTFAITPTFSCNHQTGVIGYNDNLYITFARGFVETDLEKYFIRTLTENGVKVTTFSNYWESQP